MQLYCRKSNALYHLRVVWYLFLHEVLVAHETNLNLTLWRKQPIILQQCLAKYGPWAKPRQLSVFLHNPQTKKFLLHLKLSKKFRQKCYFVTCENYMKFKLRGLKRFCWNAATLSAFRCCLAAFTLR